MVIWKGCRERGEGVEGVGGMKYRLQFRMLSFQMSVVGAFLCLEKRGWGFS